MLLRVPLPLLCPGATSQLGGGVKGLKDLNLGVFLETQTAEHVSVLALADDNVATTQITDRSRDRLG